MASAARCSSAGEERNGEGRGMEGHPDHAQMMNKLVAAVMKKLAYSDPSKTLTLDKKKDIKRQVCRLIPVFKTPDHPTYAAMIREAIVELNEEHGSTEESISKFITEKFDSLPLAHASFLSLHLKKLNERGEIVRVSKNCYMLPGGKADSLSKRECVPRQKQAQKGKGKRKSAKGDEHRSLAEEQVKETEKQAQQGHQCEEPHYDKAVDDQTESLEKESIQDKVNGRQCQRKIEAIAANAEQQSQEKIEDQQRKVIDDQEGSSDAQQGEVIKEQIQDIAVIVVPLKHNYEVPKKKVEVPEQLQQLEQQSEVLIREEQHSVVIDYQNGSPVEETVQQHEASTPKSRNQEPITQVIVEKVGKQNVEHDSMVINCQNGSPDEETVQQDEANSLKSHNQVQVPGVIVEEQNIEKTYKEDDEVHVEVTEQLRENGHEIQDSIQAEQHSEMINDKYGSTDGQKDTVNGHKNRKNMQEVALIVDKQNVEVKKDQVTEEQVEVMEQKTEYVKQSEEPMQHMKGIDCENGSSKKQTKQKDEVNGQQSENQMHTAVVVGKSNFSEQTHIVNEEKQDEVTEIHVQVTEQQVEVTEQQGEYEQQSQVASLEEQTSKVIEYQNGSPEQQNKQQDDVNEDQLQEIILSVEKQNDAKLKVKVADEHIEASMDKIFEEQCQTEEQSCEVIEQHTQAVKSDIQLNGKVVEAILTGTKAQQNDIISERNRPQDQFELTSMQELLSMNQEKDAATVVNSNVPIANSKFSHDITSKFSEMTCKLLENNIKLQEKTHKLLEDKIKVEIKTHRLLENNIKVQEKTLQVQEMLFELLKGFKDTNRNLVIEERLTPNIGQFGERESIDCDLPAKQGHRPEISAQTKALESQVNEVSASLELPTDATQLFLKQGKLWNFCQQQVPKYQNKSVETLPDAVQPQLQEIGISERLWELPTIEGDIDELSGPVRKKIRSSIDANHATEKQLQVHNAEVNPDFQEKQLSVSDCEVAEAPKCQDEDHEAENVIKEKAVQSSPPSLKLAESEQSCQRQLEKQGQQLQRQLCLQGRKSESDSGVAMAPEFQQEEQPKDPIHEKAKLDHKPADQHKFCPGGQMYSISELSLATSLFELLARKNQDTEGKIEEKTRELKASAKETGQTQLQLNPRSENLFKSKHSSLSNTGMPQLENPGVKPQLKKQSLVGKPGVGDSSQLKKRQDNHLNKRKRCTPEPTTMPDAIGATLTCQIGSGPMIDANPEALQDLRPTMSDHSYQPMEKKQNSHGQRKKSNPTAGGSPDELTLASQHLVVDPQILVKPLQLNSAVVGQLAQTTKQSLQKQQLLHHMKLRSQSEPDVSIVGELSQTTKELPQKQQLPCHRKLSSCSQAASQCEPDVQMIELPSSKHPCEKPQEQKHPKRPQKQRGRPPKPTLDRAGPAKLQKLQEQPERRGRPPKSDVNTTSGGEINLKEQTEATKESRENKASKSDQRKSTDSSEGKISKRDSRNSKESSEGESSKGDQRNSKESGEGEGWKSDRRNIRKQL